MINCVKALRLSDNRDIYIKAYLSDNQWMDIINILIDLKYKLTSINELDYAIASSENKFCLILEKNDYNTFIEFIQSNCYSVHELRERRFNKVK